MWLRRIGRAGVEQKVDDIHALDAVMVERRVVVEGEQELGVVVADGLQRLVPLRLVWDSVRVTKGSATVIFK